MGLSLAEKKEYAIALTNPTTIKRGTGEGQEIGREHQVKWMQLFPNKILRSKKKQEVQKKKCKRQ